jgi:PadR family transcriptional regulator, regulatory protein PadR
MLGKTEELVLLATHRAGAKSTASEIYSIIEETLSKTLGKSVAFGGIFTTLERLSNKGLISFEKDIPRQDYGGRSPRLYSLSSDGAVELSRSLSVTKSLVRGFSVPQPAQG